MTSPTALYRALRPMVFVYLLFVSAIAAFLIVSGYLLSRIPGLPAGIESAYSARMLDLFDALVRPFDALPSVNSLES